MPGTQRFSLACLLNREDIDILNVSSRRPSVRSARKQFSLRAMPEYPDMLNTAQPLMAAAMQPEGEHTYGKPSSTATSRTALQSTRKSDFKPDTRTKEQPPSPD
jgi:hypothetical protein